MMMVRPWQWWSWWKWSDWDDEMNNNNREKKNDTKKENDDTMREIKCKQSIQLNENLVRIDKYCCIEGCLFMSENVPSLYQTRDVFFSLPLSHLSLDFFPRPNSVFSSYFYFELACCLWIVISFFSSFYPKKFLFSPSMWQTVLFFMLSVMLLNVIVTVLFLTRYTQS